MRRGSFGKTKSRQNDALDVVLSETSRLNNLVTDLLTIGKLEAGKLTLAKSSFRFSDITDPIYTNMIRKRGLRFRNDTPKSLIVTGDRDRVKQILINLLNNAMKFTSHGGTITLSASKGKRTWSFSVQDTGIGVDPDKIRKMFDRFYQLDDHMTRKQAGFGLGLSIVKRLVDLHDGKIDVSSEKGKGTMFRITLPL